MNTFNAMFLPGVGYLSITTCVALSFLGHSIGLIWIVLPFLVLWVVGELWRWHPAYGLSVGSLVLWATVHFGISHGHNPYFWEDISVWFGVRT